jgi:hypothetical protein
VFLSSPGDVSEERRAARKVLTDLAGGNLLKGRVDFDIVAYDDPLAGTPLLATETPQESVNRYKVPPSQCDLTIVILWSRLGTPLGLNMARPDGTTYASGTEWEYEDARKAGKPVFLYVRSEKPKFEADDDERVLAELNQYKKVKWFVNGLKGPDAVTRVGVNSYDKPEVFRTLLEQHMEAEIRRRLDEAGVSLAPEAVSKDFSIFLAATADDMLTAQLALESQLKKRSDIRVLDKIPPPIEKEDHETAVRAYVKKADLCVHLLNASAGARVVDDTGTTYVLEQARIARQDARAQLILHPSEFRNDMVADDQYKTFLEQLKSDPDDGRRLELVRIGVPQMLNQVLTARKKIDEDRQKALARKAFIDSNQLDTSAAFELVKFLSDHEREVILSTWKDRAQSSLDDFFNNLKGAKHFLLIFGKVEKTVVDERLEIAHKHIALKELPTKVGIFVVGPAKSPSDLKFQFDYPVIDSTGGFNEKALNDFLNGGAPS